MKTMKYTAFTLLLTLCSGCASTPTHDRQEIAATGQLGDVCARVDTPRCQEGLFCRPGQDHVSRCVAQQFAQEGEVCGTFAVIECDEGLECDAGKDTEVVADGSGICITPEP